MYATSKSFTSTLAEEHVRCENERETLERNKVVETIQKKIKAALYGTSVKDFFERCDKDGNGTLDEGEIKAVVRKVLKIPPSSVSDRAIHKLFQLLDDDGSGDVEIDEIVDFVESGLKERYIKERADREEKKRLLLTNVKLPWPKSTVAFCRGGIRWVTITKTAREISREEEKEKKYTFKPSLCQRSLEMDARRTGDQDVTGTKRIDMMEMKKRMVQSKVSHKREFLEKEEVKDCTWKPEITNYLERVSSKKKRGGEVGGGGKEVEEGVGGMGEETGELEQEEEEDEEEKEKEEDEEEKEKEKEEEEKGMSSADSAPLPPAGRVTIARAVRFQAPPEPPTVDSDYKNRKASTVSIYEDSNDGSNWGGSFAGGEEVDISDNNKDSDSCDFEGDEGDPNNDSMGRKSVKGWDEGVTIQEYLQEPAHERLYGRRNNPKTHRATSEEHWEQRELSQCTFEPKINKGTRELKGRKQRRNTYFGLYSDHMSKEDLKLSRGRMKSIHHDEEGVVPAGFYESIKMRKKVLEEQKKKKEWEENAGYTKKSWERARKLQKEGVKAFSFDGRPARSRRQPKLYMDVKISASKKGRIGICDGDKPATLARDFARTYSLNGEVRRKLEGVVERYMEENGVRVGGGGKSSGGGESVNGD